MNSQEFLQSGLLELYAAGALAPPEQEEVERMALLYPEVKVALAQITQTLEAYAHLHARQPRPELKEAILERIPEGNREEDAFPDQADTRTIPFTPILEDDSDYEIDDTRLRPLSGEKSEAGSGRQMTLVASVALLVLSVLANLYLYSNWQQTQNHLAAANAREQQYVQTNQTMQNLLTFRNLELAILRDPEFRQVPLKGLAIAPEASATVYWNARSREVFVSIASLPPPPAGSQYQLWAFDEGQPFDAGLFTLEAAGGNLQAMKPIGRAQAFAVTLEPEGGSQSPTLDNLVLMGPPES